MIIKAAGEHRLAGHSCVWQLTVTAEHECLLLNVVISPVIILKWMDLLLAADDYFKCKTLNLKFGKAFLNNWVKVKLKGCFSLSGG